MKNMSCNFMLLNEVIRSPREIGALCPSSERLGNTMASLVCGGDEGLVVELGAGTGVITESLLRSGIAMVAQTGATPSPVLRWPMAVTGLAVPLLGAGLIGFALARLVRGLRVGRSAGR